MLFSHSGHMMLLKNLIYTHQAIMQQWLLERISDMMMIWLQNTLI